MLPALRALSTTPASREAVMQILGRRFALYPQPERTDGEWVEWWDDYLEALDGLAEPAIEAGMAAYVKLPDSEFFPKPGRVRELAKMTPNAAAMAYHTADVLLGGAEPPAPRPSMSEEQMRASREAVRRMCAETVEALTKPKPTPPPLPPIQAKVDETGVSDELRAVLARQADCRL